jgi:hypothetical protein
MDEFVFPVGAQQTGVDEEGNPLFAVSMPSDEDGYFSRQCPQCDQAFRILQDDYEALPDDARLWCVYCGHRDDHSEFLTDQQRDRAIAVVKAYAEQMIGSVMDAAFGDLERSSRGNKFVQFKYRRKPYFVEPLPHIDEERLRRAIRCPRCAIDYAVFGEHRYCPSCGPLSEADIAQDALNAEVRKMEALDALPEEVLGELRDHGVLDRSYADTLRAAVSIVETHAKNAFNSRVPTAAELVKGRGNVFQRLDDTADLFLAHFGIDLRNVADLDWNHAHRVWAARHVLTHNDGIVDAKYKDKVPGDTPKLGQRLVIRREDALGAIGVARMISMTID